MEVLRTSQARSETILEYRLLSRSPAESEEVNLHHGWSSPRRDLSEHVDH